VASIVARHRRALPDCGGGEQLLALEDGPEKRVAVFPRNKRNGFAPRSCSTKNLERDGDSTYSHRALDASVGGGPINFSSSHGQSSWNGDDRRA
jgi:hypothetical protein